MLKAGQTLTFCNLDGVPHTIETDRQHQFALGAGGTKTIRADFGHGAEVYGITCDNGNKLEGLFLVEN